MIARIWKQPRCPSTKEWIQKMWYIYPMEHYSPIKSKEANSFRAYNAPQTISEDVTQAQDRSPFKRYGLRVSQLLFSFQIVNFISECFLV